MKKGFLITKLTILIIFPLKLSLATGDCAGRDKVVQTYYGINISLSCKWKIAHEESYHYFVLPNSGEPKGASSLHHEYQNYASIGDLYQGSVSHDSETNKIIPNENTKITLVQERFKKIIEYTKKGVWLKEGLLSFPIRIPKEILKVSNMGKRTFSIEGISKSNDFIFIVFNFSEERDGKIPVSWILFTLSPSKSLFDNQTLLEGIRAEIRNAIIAAANDKYGRNI